MMAPPPKNMAQRHRNLANTNSISEYEADLTSSDRNKQKRALRILLAEKVRNDWSFPWPPAEDSISETQGISTFQGTDQQTSKFTECEWKERDEWLSNLSDVGEKISSNASTLPLTPNSPIITLSNSSSIEKIEDSLRERRRIVKANYEKELLWNDGLRCFTARRDAWTQARVTLRPELKSPTSSTQVDEENEEMDAGSKELELEVVLEIPIAPSIIPADNFVRKSITPRAYSVIFDKVVMNSIVPTCPINLKDVIRSCVEGWKRNGEWPSSCITESLPSKEVTRMSTASLFPGCEPDDYSLRGESFQNDGNHGSMDNKDNAGDIEESNTKRKSLGSCFNRMLGRG
ncbi:unnamed protein product [Blumeria hordei]|uniref:Gag1-like clamp domain-containing protein n=2 Tax=Blumeria hordei TaxID=2867405 RepID=A0A383UR68_BLUHO|nr:hypothetical protein BGHDH14_bgh01267 [Blumeria hordei DH14]SZF02065.1 unnamed protein product [Blumeria hordei]